MKKILPLSILILLGLTACTGVYKHGEFTISSKTIPLLKGVEKNRTLSFSYTVPGLNEPFILSQVWIDLVGSDAIADIAQVSLYAEGVGQQGKDSLLAATTQITEKLTLNTNYTFTEPTTHFVVSVLLKDHINIEHKIVTRLEGLKSNRGIIDAPDMESTTHRYAIPVHQKGMDGVHTARIPGLEMTNEGTLIAVYDARWDNARDLQGDIDIVIKRSTDKGVLWKPMLTVLDMKEWGGLPEKYNGVSDANILVDRETGKIFIFALWMHGVLDPETGEWVEGLTSESTVWNHQWAKNGSKVGVGLKESSQFMMITSEDDGITWSEPTNLTPLLKKIEWSLLAPAPGHGITLADGTLVVPVQGRDKKGVPFSTIMSSKDHGKTWNVGRPASVNTTESMAVELSDGTVMLNIRDNRNAEANAKINGRSIFTTTNLGETWQEHPTSRKALIEPLCMGSIHKHTYTVGEEEKSILLFMNPNSKTERNNLTIKVSFDDGNTWPEAYNILLDEVGGYGYSCITSIDEGAIGVLYESSVADMTFQRISLEELIFK